jgi:pyruvate-formate lyase-activating enzyme
MKQTIRSFIIKIPLAKSLYHAVKKRREELHRRCAENQLRKKQPIIRQGSPECFESLSLKVDWALTSYCNFRCSYCFSAGSEYKKDFCTLEQAETAIKHLASANRPRYQVALLGGEPTTHPHLAEIITLLHKYLGDRLESLVIVSNGSLNEKQMESIIKEGEQHLIKMIFSVHLEYMRIERVVELVKRLSNHIQLHVHLMLHPELFAKARIMVETLCELRKDYPFLLEIVMLRKPPKFESIDSRYTQDHQDWAEKAMRKFENVALGGAEWTKCYSNPPEWEFLVEKRVDSVVETYEKTHQSRLKELTENIFTGLTCCAGTNVAQIKVDGNVRGMVCPLDRPTCNIFEENPFLREDWMHGVFCTRAICRCNVNYRIPKFKSPAAAQKFIAEKKLEQKKLMSESQDA